MKKQRRKIPNKELPADYPKDWTIEEKIKYMEEHPSPFAQYKRNNWNRVAIPVKAFEE